MIKSSHFISKHLRNYYDKVANWRDCLIVQYARARTYDLSVCELLIDNKKNRVLSYQEIEAPICNTFFCGPCDGIYFLWCIDYYASEKCSIWNPALNELKILPDITWNPNLPPDSTNIRESFGFGYDSKAKDYKVILILGYRDMRDEGSRFTDNPMSILIYSLKSNSWRHWGNVDKYYDLEVNRTYVFINGCYHWIVSPLFGNDLSYETLITFDISDEVYKEILLPRFEYGLSCCSQLVVYHDSIGFVCVPEDKTSFSVWTWKEEVWTQKLAMKVDVGVWGPFNQWRDDTVVFTQEGGRLVLWDTNTEELSFLMDLRERGGCANVSAYKDSLVSINEFN